MFTKLKNQIKEETGEVPSLPIRSTAHQRYQRASMSSNCSIDELSAIEQRDGEINALRLQYQDLSIKFNELTEKFCQLQDEKEELEKTNELLNDSVKVAQVQKELVCDEQDKIQNLQMQEITKLKSMLMFREQEAVDRLSVIRQTQDQLECCKAENSRLREIETTREEIQDELERLRRTSNIELNNLKTNLATVEEQNRHLISKLKIFEDSRINFTSNLGKDEKVLLLLQERKLFEQRLEEAHLHLSDIKSSWSAQNLALETQVSRLSRQVAAETTEKRKAIKSQEESIEKFKQVQFELEKSRDEIKHRDNKIKILEEVVDDLSSTLSEIRTENEEEIKFLRSKSESLTKDNESLRSRLETAEDRYNECLEDTDENTRKLRNQLIVQQEEINELKNNLENAIQGRNSDLLQNAEISQNLERLKTELRDEKIELSELTDSWEKLQQQLIEKDGELKSIQSKFDEQTAILESQELKILLIDEMQQEIADKNKTIKILNQRLADFKKTLQHELKNGSVSNKPGTAATVFVHPNNNHPLDNTNKLNKNQNDSQIESKDLIKATDGQSIVMDEVNFKYLKHVILKFLTSRDVEARHLVRAVCTLLNLTVDEEKLLHDTVNYKMSWFGTRPEYTNTNISNTKVFSLLPS